jgi:AcrR family transcriptional regulator
MSSCNALAPAIGAQAVSDDTDNAILDAARDCVLAFGVRRTSLSDVARRAGVSRPTVYRRWRDLRALVADLMTRELASVFASASPDDEGQVPGSVRERAVSQLVTGAGSLRAHPLLTKIIQVDPEMLQPYIFDRLGTSQRMALGFIADMIKAGQRDGSIRAGDGDAMSATVLLSVQSSVLSTRLTAGLITPALRDAELAVLLDRYLRPESEAGLPADGRLDGSRLAGRE